MEDIIAILVILVFSAVGYYFISKKRKKDKENRPVRTTKPNIPDHQAEKDGDVNNGKTFSSFSSAFAPLNLVTNAQRIYSGGVVVATQQVEQNISEVVLGTVIRADEGLPEPLENYTFKATILGDQLTFSPPVEGTLADLPKWVLNHIPNTGGNFDLQPIDLITRPKHTRVYLEIEAPKGYRGGVVILDLLIETGM